MGSLCSKHRHNTTDTEENAQTAEIERRIELETKAEKHIQKLLLLGAGESGKSTIFKQIKLLFQTGFDDAELKSYISVIHANVYQIIKILHDGAKELTQNETDFSKYAISDENKEIGKKLSEIGSKFEYPRLNRELAQEIETLWKDGAIQETYSRGNELQVPDCTHYFMENLQRLADVDYVPTKEDVLYARIRTTGVVEIQFSPVGENKKSGEVYKLFDVGLKRLTDEDAKAAIAISVSEVTTTPEVLELSKEIKEKLKEADQHDLEGKTDMKIRALEVVEELRTKRADKQSMLLLDAFNKDRASLPQPLPNPPPLAPFPVVVPDARTQEMINEKLKKAEDLGEQGMVDEAQKALEEAEELKKLPVIRQEPVLDSSKYTAADVRITDQKLRVCDICGAFLSVYDSDRRLADHFGGKLHLGYMQIREKLADIKDERDNKRKASEELRRSKERSRDHDREGSRDRGGSRERLRDHDRRSRDRDMHNDRDRGYDRERDRERDRSHSYDSRSRRRSRSRERARDYDCHSRHYDRY